MTARVVLIGPMAAGKTKVGKRVSSLLGAPRLDTDKMFVAEQGEIATFFSKHGEDEFRRIEEALVARAVATDSVVSLGGGAVLARGTQARLAELPVVYLTVSPDAVAERLEGGKRPLVAHGGVDAWLKIFEARRPLYERLATRTYDTSRGNLDEISRDIVEWITNGYPAESEHPQ